MRSARRYGGATPSETAVAPPLGQTTAFGPLVSYQRFCPAPWTTLEVDISVHARSLRGV